MNSATNTGGQARQSSTGFRVPGSWSGTSCASLARNDGERDGTMPGCRIRYGMTGRTYRSYNY
ncbi:MAG TPA: hypothetical protein PK874_01620 [Desulfobacteraceae bacterium]|nr:hypothetical protein [Desulfobacteraceae bacterium]HPJ67386.1 hypothetical protein [Desulfobacteraceae bacterium]